MDDNHIGAGKLALQETIQPFAGCIEAHIKGRKGLAKTNQCVSGCAAVLGGEILHRPAIALLVAANLVAELDQLMGQTAQEVRVAVVPIRDPRVRKKAKAQARVHAILATDDRICWYALSYSATIRAAVNF